MAVRRALKALAVSATLATASLVFVSGPASAAPADEATILASAGCTVGLTSSSCTTASLPANSSGHYINWGASTLARGCHWVVRDTNNGVIVGQGNLGAFDEDGGTIRGLYSRYRLELTSCGPGNSGGINNN